MSGVLDIQRAMGAVVGSAVGDALGAPFEFGLAGAYRARFPEPVLGGTGELVGGGSFGWAPGEFTDDTQMAIVQATSLLERGGIDEADLFARFRAWALHATDVGILTRSVLSSRLPWNEAAADYHRRHPDRSASNGGLMRAVPSAVRFASEDETATIEAARRLAAVTHADPAVGWGAALLHVAVGAALRGDDALGALDACVAALPPDQSRYRELLHPGWTPDHGGPRNGTVWGCLAQAVWAVRTTTTFADAVVAAIDLGDDTDTVAAVAGGLAGAVHGIQAIPSRWTTYVHGRIGDRTFRYRDLQDLAHALIGVAPAPLNELEVAKRPAEITPGVFAADLAGAASVPTEWAVVSLCRTQGLLDDHPVRRELFLVDRAGRNPGLHHVVADALATIEAFLAEGRKVVVHCHGGASRTGLVLRAWLMRQHGCDAEAATTQLAARWPHLNLWNKDFSAYLAGTTAHPPARDADEQEKRA